MEDNFTFNQTIQGSLKDPIDTENRQNEGDENSNPNSSQKEKNLTVG